MRHRIFAFAALATALASSSLIAAPGESPPADRACPSIPGGKAFANLFEQYRERRYYDGVFAMAQNGETAILASGGVAVPGFGVPYRDDQRVRLASISKMFTAVMAMQLVEEGKLDLDETIAEMLPDFDASYAGKVRLRHLLSHRSGIPNMQYSEAETALFSRAIVEKSDGEILTLAEVVELFRGEALLFEPGSDQRYSNSNTMLVQAIIERADARDYASSLAARITRPLGLDDTGVAGSREFVPGLAIGRVRALRGWNHGLQRHTTNPPAVGGVYSNAPEMLAFASALFEGRLFRDRATLQRMMPEPGAMFGMGINRIPLMVDGVEYEAFGHDGWAPPYTASLAALPDCGTVYFAADSSAGFNGAARRGNGHGEIFGLTEGAIALGSRRSPSEPEYLLFERFSDRFAEGFDMAKQGLIEDLDNLRPIENPARDLRVIGNALLSRGDHAEALAILAIGASRYPDDPALQLGIAQANGAMDRPVPAAAAYRRTLELLPADHGARAAIEAELAALDET